MAIEYAHVDVVKALIEEGADVNKTRGFTNLNDETYALLKNAALLEAAKNDDVDEVERLITIGASVNVVDKYEKTPLHWATVYGGKEIVEALINAETKVDTVNKYERTPLHWAALYDRKEIVEALINAKAKVDAQDKLGETPFDLTTNEEIKTLLQNAEKN